jgi:type II secretory pathway pseudopilin PulG
MTSRRLHTHASRPSTGEGEYGFSLAEILLAMAVAALLMTMLLSVLSKSMDVSKRNNAGMLSKSSAQAALDMIATDLDSLAMGRNLGEVVRFVNSATQPSPITNSTLYLVSSSPGDSYSTDGTGYPGCPRLVQYSVLFTTNYASTSSNSFGLYRNVVDPSTTLSAVISQGQPLDSAWANYGPASNNLLVPNVVSMRVSLLTNYGASTMTLGSGLLSQDVGVITTTNLATFPPGTCVEVSLTVLDDSALARFGSGNGLGNNSPAALMKSQGRTLVRRILLPSLP